MLARVALGSRALAGAPRVTLVPVSGFAAPLGVGAWSRAPLSLASADGEAPKAAKKRRAKKDPNAPKRKTSLNTFVYELSPELAAIVGMREATRTDVTRQIWAYVKGRGLQDGRTIKPGSDA